MNERLLPTAVLRFSRANAEKIVTMYEQDGGLEVTAGDQQLLDRYFLEHEDQTLSERYKQALDRLSRP